MTALSRNLLLAFAALGLAASSTSAYVHYQLLTQPSYASFCDVNDTVNCTQAYLSRYGSFLGVPVAIPGMLFFAVMLALAVVARRRTPAAESAPGYMFALSTIGLAFVLYLAWASYFVLKAFCVLCAITYVSVIAIFIISGGTTSYPMTTLPRRALRDARTLVSTPLALLVALLIAGGAASLIAFFPHEGPPAAAEQAPGVQALTDQQRADIAKWWDLQPKEDLPVPADGAKVLFVKFSDYMCPACRQTYELYKPLLAKYEARGVKSVLKHYPLEPECNPNVPTGNHFASCEASAAVIMARRHGTADKLEEWIYTNQATLTRDSVRKAALDVGGITDYDARYASAIQEVKMDATLGGLVQIKSTPTFFLNGRRLVGGIDPRALEAIIELELSRAK
jgi:uncharacterized membrane protein/protein-disulfide isomerase